jgi:adenylylsulfate kinase
MTGLQAPYEEPLDPEVVVDTENHTPEESLDMIISALKKLGYL